MDTRLASSRTDELTPYRLVFAQVQVLIPAGTYVVGRDRTSCNIILRQDSVSRRHGMLTATPSALEICDLQSENGVFVNGTRVEKSVLKQGDVVRLGRIRFEIAEEAVEFANMRENRGARTTAEVGDTLESDDAVAISSSTISLGDPSSASVEIPADILAQSLYDQLDESVDAMPVTPANDFAATREMNVGEIKLAAANDRRAAPPPLIRQTLAEGGGEPVTHDRLFRRREESAPSWWARFLDSTAGRLALLLLVGWSAYFAFPFVHDPHSRDRQIAEQLEGYGARIEDLRLTSATSENWSQLKQDVNRELPAIVAALEKTASSQVRGRQSLLRAARDCLPKMLDSTAEPTWHEDRYHEYLGEANQMLASK